MMRTAASFSQKGKNAHANICPNYQSFIYATALKGTSGRASLKCASASLLLSLPKPPTRARIAVCDSTCFACVQILPLDDNVSIYHRPSGFPLKSPSWANTSCCPPKGRCLSDRWTGCRHTKKHRYCMGSSIFLIIVQIKVMRLQYSGISNDTQTCDD